MAVEHAAGGTDMAPTRLPTWFGANLLLQPDRLAYGVLGQLQIMFSSLTSTAGLYGLRRGLRAGDAALDNAPRQSVHAEAAGGFAATVKAVDHLAP